MILGVAAIAMLFWCKGRRATLGEAVIVFLAGAAVSGGLKVCLFSLDPFVFRQLGGNRIYVFLGGLAVIWVFGETIWRVLRES